MCEERPETENRSDSAFILELLFAGGALFPEQLSRPSHWPPEKELAASVLLDALVEVQDFLNQPRHKGKVAQDLEWIFFDDDDWPFSFAFLCEVFGLDPDFVRKTVLSWLFGAVAGSKIAFGRYPVAA